MSSVDKMLQNAIDNIAVDISNQMFGNSQSGVSIANGTGSSGGAGSAGSIVHVDPSTGNLTWSTGQVTTIADLMSAMGAPAPLTPEENKELEILEEERKRNLKQFQVDQFKKLPSSLRQRVVDSIMWHRELTRIEAETVSTAGKTQRQLDLEARRISPYISIGSGLGSAGSSWYHAGSAWSPLSSQAYMPVLPFTLPSQLTEDDIIAAHTEATLEEECLSER